MSTTITGYTKESIYDKLANLETTTGLFKVLTNVLVSSDLWVEDTTYDSYGYRAVIPFEGVDASYSPDVRLGYQLEQDGKICFASCETDNTVSLYATEGYEETVTIPVIICMKVGE